MCRWNAWFGQPIMLDELLYQTQHGLIDQSLHARMGVETTNGDGFGIGWYRSRGGEGVPGRYRNLTPAWNDPNLHELAKHIESPLFLAHIRATTGTPVEQTNCHPFRQGRWLFVHNGAINGFHLMRRDPIAAVEHAVGLVESTGHAHGVQYPVQMTLGISDGEKLWAVRYSSEGKSRTLYASADAATVRALHPDNPRFQRFTDKDRVIVSEPLSDLQGAWIEVPDPPRW